MRANYHLLMSVLSLFVWISGSAQHPGTRYYKVSLRNAAGHSNPLKEKTVSVPIQIIFKTDDTLSLGSVPFRKGNETFRLTGGGYRRITI